MIYLLSTLRMIHWGRTVAIHSAIAAISYITNRLIISASILRMIWLIINYLHLFKVGMTRTAINSLLRRLIHSVVLSKHSFKLSSSLLGFNKSSIKRALLIAMHNFLSPAVFSSMICSLLGWIEVILVTLTDLNAFINLILSPPFRVY